MPKKRISPEELAEQQQLQKDLELATQCARLKSFQEREQALFNEFQLQRDKLNHFWIIAKKQLEDKKADLRNKEREIQDLQERHNREITVLKQRVKHLLFEHQTESTDSKTDGVVALKMAQDGHRESEEELKRDRRALAGQLREMEAAHEAYMRELRRDNDRAMTDLRLEFERDSRELQMQYQHRLETLRRELFDRRVLEVRRVETRKAKHVAQLLAAHEKAFADIKSYYQAITHSNLDTIKSLKQEVNQLAREEEMDEKKIVKIAKENKDLAVPLAQALEDARALRAEKEAYERDLMELRDTNMGILETETQLNTLRWEFEILAERHGRLERERDELRERFTSALYEVQQKSGFRNLLLERKMDAAEEEVEKRSTQLAEVLVRVDAGGGTGVRGRLEEVMTSKEAALSELRQELDRVVAAHNGAIGSFAAKLAEKGVRPEEMGFRPLLAEDVLKPLGVLGPEAIVSSATAAAAAAARGASAGASAASSRGAGRVRAGAAATTASGAGAGPAHSRLGVSGRPRARLFVPAKALEPAVAAGGPRAAAAASAMV